MARHEKVAEVIRREVSSIIHDELKDPRLGFITIIRVEMPADLSFARIFYSVLGDQQAQEKSKEALDSANGFIRRLIGQRIQLRLVPEIIFKQDKSSEYSIRIQQVLDEIKELEKNNEPRPSNNARAGKEPRKEGRDEPDKKDKRVPKKKK